MSSKHPKSGKRPAAKTCSLAVWSVVLGILGLFFWVLAAIPAVICGHKALSRIKRSGGILAGQGLARIGLVTGYGVIVLPILVVILLASTMYPKLAQARHNAQVIVCVNNLRVIYGAKKQWALEHQKQDTDTPTMEDLRIYLGRGKNRGLPACPSGGVYTLGKIGEKPTCSIPDHVLP